MNLSKSESLIAKLRLRYNRICESYDELFHYQLRQFILFIETNPVYFSIISECIKKNSDAGRKASIITNPNGGPSNAIYLEFEEENIAISYFVIKSILDAKRPEEWTVETHLTMIPIKYGAERGFDKKYYYHFFLQLFISPLVDYIEEKISNQSLILNSLRRFKQLSEWYKASELFDLYKNNTKVGETVLKKNLYEFLFIEGIEYVIEPESVSGITDTIIFQKDHKIIVEAKIFDGDINTVIKGFNQLYTYNNNFNEPFGYLILFKICEKDLKFQLKMTDDNVPYIIYNNKSFFFIIIDINQGKSASKKSNLVVGEITEDMLISITKNI